MPSNQNQASKDTTLRTMMRVSQAILRIRTDRKRLLKTICDIIVEEQGYESIWIGEFRHGDIYPSVASNNAAGQPQELKTWIAHAPFDASTAQKVVEQKCTLVTKHRPIKFPDLSPLPWVTAAVPVYINDEVAAILNACTFQADRFDEQELKLLEELAIDVGFALESINSESRRREAEDALRISEGRFRQLSENSLVGIVLIQNDLLRYVNPALATMFGYADPKDMIDQLGPLDLVAPSQHDMMAQNLHRSLMSHALGMRYTFKGLRRDGTHFDVEAYSARTIHARRPAIIATLLDITERVRAHHQLEALSEASLAMSRERDPEKALQTAVQLALNVVPGDAANIYLIQDTVLVRAAEEGYQPSEDATSNLVPREHFEMVPTFQTMLNTRAPLLINDTRTSDLWSPNPQRKTVRAYLGTSLIVRGEIIGFLNVDGWEAGIFAREDAQHLQRFADYVAATIEHLRLIASLEAEQQRLLLLNQLSHTLSETLEPKEVAERALSHIGQALGAQQGLVYVWDAQKKNISVLSGQGISSEAIAILDTRVSNNQNTVARWVVQHRKSALIQDVRQDMRWLIVPGVDDWVASALDVPLEVHGELIGVLSLLSEQPAAFSPEDQRLLETLSVPVALALQNARFYQAAAHQARVMTEALRRQEELDRMKDELIQNISHELRTPLALVLGYATMLHQGELGPVAPEQATAIDIITRRSHMLRTLVENITLLWQLESDQEHKAEPEPIDLCELARAVVEEFQHQAQEQHITLDVTTARCPLIVDGIMLQMRRVLDNLIGNALKFTPVEGHIAVEVKCQAGDILMTVSDTGIGVTQDKLEKIFERFYQVDGSSKRRYGGTGLGLALVRAIAEAHGGTAHAESPLRDDPDHPGTRIVVRLPRRDDPGQGPKTK